MANYWKPTNNRLFGRILCCKHSITHELAAMSRHGEIYEYNPSTIGIIVRSVGAHKRIKRLLGVYGGFPISKGEEAVFKAGVEYLDEVVNILKIKKNRLSMAKLLNSGGKVRKSKNNENRSLKSI